jgi:hypothetical protein
MRWYVWLGHLLFCSVLNLVADYLVLWAQTNSLPRTSYWLEWVIVVIGIYGIFISTVLWCAIIVHIGRLIEAAINRVRTLGRFITRS